MRAMGNYRSARTIGLALVAGLIAFEAALVLGAGAVGIPGVFLVRFADESGGAKPPRGSEDPEGGQSDVAKLSAVPESSVEEAAKPLSPVAPAGGEPRLEGLADIPLTPWDRPNPEPAEAKAFAADSSGREVLPWDAVEPVPFSPTPAPQGAPTEATAALAKPPMPETPRAPVALAELPASGDVEAWVRAKASEVKGEERARPLYHFEYWLEPPEEMKQRLAAVAYEFNTPAVMPQSQVSSERKTGFRILAGGLTCPDKVTVTLKFKDGRSKQVVVDGCRLVDKDDAA
jgi:hypothetical protein